MLKQKKAIATIYLTLMVAAYPVAAKTGTPSDTEAINRGLSLYTTNCVSCHQKDGLGEVIPWGVRNPNYLAAMPLNESSHAWHHKDEQLIQMIQQGNQRMPPFQTILSASELRDVVAYIKSLWSDRILACQGPKHMSCM